MSANRFGLCGVLPVRSEKGGYSRTISEIGCRGATTSRTMELTWEEEHLSLFDPHITEHTLIDNLEDHVALVLVEPLLQSRTRSREEMSVQTEARVS